MHNNVFWRAFLLVVLAFTLYYTGLATYRYYVYSSLSEGTSPSKMEWRTIKKMEDQFILESSYTFSVNGHSYSGKTIWEDEKYLNEYAANNGIQENKEASWTVWYKPSDPERSTLHKEMPSKEILYTIFLWGLFLYFLWIGFYVGSYR